jgi:hypothetical protein
MRIRASIASITIVLALAGAAEAQPGTAYVQARGGAMIPLGDFSNQQKTGGAYTIAAGYEFIDYVALGMEFTQSFNPSEKFRYSEPGLTVTSEETHQTFVVTAGPRINFLPAHFRVRPYAQFQVGWYHFANFNSIEINGRGILSDEDDDRFGFNGGLGVEGTVLQVYERSGDEIPMLEMTVGAIALYHQAIFGDDPDRQFLTAMGTVGLRF